MNTNINFDNITKEDILKAFDEYDNLKNNNMLETKRKFKNYILFYNSKEYPHKYIVGIAYGIRNNTLTLDSEQYNSTGTQKYSAEWCIKNNGFELYSDSKYRKHLENKYPNKNTVNTYYSDLKKAIKIFQNIPTIKTKKLTDIITTMMDRSISIDIYDKSQQELGFNDKQLFSTLKTKAQEYLEAILVQIPTSQLKDIEIPNIKQPLNQILYGPPGTGKTYKLQNEYFDKFENHTFITFHQSYAYEEFIEGIKPRTKKCSKEKKESTGDISYCIKDGIFKQACQKALDLTDFNGSIEEFCKLDKNERKEYFNDDTPKYAIFIDEINRGNISKIFGELITLVEDSKRLGASDDIVATLPYSEELFGVPKNLYIIGTMNTADRSIAHIDTALRRRFEFVEMMPEYDELDFEIIENGKIINIGNLLKSMNDRIEVLYDREHTIGHSYFMDLNDDSEISELHHIFKNKIIPLLAEYFYSDWNKIDLVFNKNGFIIPKDIPKSLGENYKKQFEVTSLDLWNVDYYNKILESYKESETNQQDVGTSEL